MRESIIQIGQEKLAQWCASRGQPAFRARQVWSWIFEKRATSFAEMTDIPLELRADLDANFAVLGTQVTEVRRTADDTQKLLITLADVQQIECVLLIEAKRRTVCVSTQVGCGMGCVFCASGLEGVARNLEVFEIVEQFLHARNLLGAREPLTHSVIMGMGEPLANLDNLLAALEIVCGRTGLNLGQRHITISTVGLPSRIRQLADSQRGYHLAVSLHAPTDELRSELVPTNAKSGIEAICAAADYFADRTGRQVTYEYVLLRDVNDSRDCANQLAKLLGGRRVHLNLIPYNPVSGLSFATPRSESVQYFADKVRREGLSVKVRKTKGRKIDAACGQLRLSRRQLPAVVRISHITALVPLSPGNAASEILNDSAEG